MIKLRTVLTHKFESAWSASDVPIALAWLVTQVAAALLPAFIAPG